MPSLPPVIDETKTAKRSLLDMSRKELLVGNNFQLISFKYTAGILCKDVV